MRALRITAWCVASTTFAFVVAACLEAAGALRAPSNDLPRGVIPFVALAVLAPTVVGLAIANRRPHTLVAWLLLAGTLPIAVIFGDPLLSSGWELQIDRASWPLLYAWPIAVTFVFPTGRLLSRRWRWVVGAAVTSYAGFMIVALTDAEPFDPPDQHVHNPLLGNAVGRALNHGYVWIPLWLGILGSLFAGALAIWLRLRRSTGVERLQTLWLAWAGTMIPLGLAFCLVASFLIGSFIDAAVFPLLLVLQAAVAGAVWVAVARHRLYAIERLFNRTVVYAALTLLLAGTYAAVSVVLGVVAGRGSDWIVAAATLSSALAFRPLRRGIQNLVDRRFDRRRYDGVRRVQTFENEVREGSRAPEEIGAVVAEALRDPQAELLFWLPGSDAYADDHGDVVIELPDDGRARADVLREGARTAVLLHDPALLERRALLESILTAATLSIEIARLRVEVRLQLAEVHASRARIVEAGYEERRRLERDLHDGAQQRLVSLGLRLRRMQRSLPRDARVLAPAFDQIVDEVGSAITDLRQIAAGVRPARLDDGLAAALNDLARHAPIPVKVDASVDRVSASVEAAAYFVACEALTNAVKHAGASRVALRAVRENGTLVVTISDDGVGGAVVRRGSGLAGLQDRVAAHSGTFELTSPRGEGTSISVAIPCAS